MKAEKILTCLTGLVLACLLSCGAMGAMISGMDLPVDHMDRLYLAWGLAALAGCVLSLPKRGYIPTLILTAAGLYYLWEYQYISLPIRALITRLSAIYDSAYGWGILEFAGVAWRSVSLDLVLGAFGCLIALTAAGTVVSGRGTIAAVGLAMLPLASTIVVTNTVPDMPFLYMLMLAVILLLLTSSVRRHCPGQGARLALLTGLPVAGLLGALFLACPKDTYVNQSREYLNSVVSWWQSNITTLWDSSGLLGQTSVSAYQNATTNLSLIGPRANWRYAVMDVTAGESGTLYLRGQDYDVYDGANWTATPDREEYFFGTMDQGSTVTIATRRNSNVLYLPYYTTDMVALTGGRAPNQEGLMEYSFRQSVVMPDGGLLGPRESTHIDYSGSSSEADADGLILGTVTLAGKEDYLALPDETRLWAADYVDRIVTEYGSNTAVAQTIAEFVRNSARYDTDTARMDREYDDFAQWFLEESDTGYCVHFATATAVLLRAAGIPARYVTGYMTEGVAGQTVTVRADEAHAWVEYYEPAVLNWIILESTPADLTGEETEPSETTQPTETEPPVEETTAPPTEPEDQTRPTDTTRPGDKEAPRLDLTPLWTALKWLLLPLGIWLAVLGQYLLRRRFRLIRCQRRKPHARALALWRETERLCRVTGQAPPEELLALAEKAKFSQHTLTAEELAVFERWLSAEREKLRQAPIHRRLVYRYVFALW